MENEQYGMTKYVSETNASIKVKIHYSFVKKDWHTDLPEDQVYGFGLHGASGSQDEAYLKVMDRCETDYNFLVKFDCP